MAQGEWWISNGIGGWASGTISCANTRKYHGLLVAAQKNAQFLLVPKLEEFAIAAQRRIPLSSNFYPGAVHPNGYENIIDFSFDGAVARWAFDALGTRICKEVWCEKGKNISYARYTLLEGRQIGIEILPFVNARDVNAIGLNASLAQAGKIKFFEQGIRFEEPVAWEISTDRGICAPAPDIYHNFEYPIERGREEAYSEDLFMPAKFGALLHEGGHITIRMGELDGKDGGAVYAEPEIASKRADALLELFMRQNAGLGLEFAQGLARASDAFVLSKGKEFGIIAGFPYFGEWGRDTMISLPGICTCTGRHALASRIVERWMEHLHNGILPNRFDADGNAVYESADAFLWMVWAISQMQEYGGVGNEELRRWLPIIRGSIESWIAGNEFVFVGDDALASLKGERSTWMDAQVDGKAVTPRAGKRIEINALWVHALGKYAHWAQMLGMEKEGDCAEIARLHKKAKRSMAKFYSAKKGYLLDGVEPDDFSLRPNQIWAIALDACPIGRQGQRKAMERIERELLVPGYGLRTLAQNDEKYIGTYFGSMRKRDLAYHQGAIWPWMLGAYAQAIANVCPEKIGKARMDISRDLNMQKAGALLFVPEVYDPQTLMPGGCPAQAWSVAECLRAAVLLEKAAKEGRLQTTGKKERASSARIANV